LSEHLSDVLNSPAVGVLVAVEADGIHVSAVGDRLRVKPVSRLTPEQRSQVEQYRPELLLLLRICDPSVQDRRDAFARQLVEANGSVPSLVFKPGTAYVPGICYSCGDALPAYRPGRCWRCSLAARLACRCPIPVDLLDASDVARVA
jgi:hypothetical protein